MNYFILGSFVEYQKTRMTHFAEIENYIRDIISKNHGIFDRQTILKQSAEWMQKFPVEFNSILNFIENEGTNDMMDDSTPSVAFHGDFADASTSSIIFGSRIDDDSTPSVAFHGGYADDSTSSVIFGSRTTDDSASSVVNMHDQMSPVSDSPMGSEHIDSSPGGYPDDDLDSCMPLQRTMSSVPFRK